MATYQTKMDGRKTSPLRERTLRPHAANSMLLRVRLILFCGASPISVHPSAVTVFTLAPQEILQHYPQQCHFEKTQHLLHRAPKEAACV